MDRFEAMRVFCKVVEAGSFAAAAARLDMSTSAASRHVAQLEAQLDARLLNRTTRRLSLTENGQAYYERCTQLLADLQEAEELVGNQAAHPRGTLRITAPISFGESHVAPAISDYLQRYPQVRVDVSLSDRQADLVEEALDLAIRIGNIANQNLVARPIGQSRLLVCAAPAYLARHGTPASAEDLAQHACLTYAYGSGQNSWSFGGSGAPPRTVRVSGPAHANNGNFLARLAAQGMGFTQGPDFILAPYVARGELVPVLADEPPRTIPIYAVYPSRRHLSAKVRSFVAFMIEWLAATPQGLARESERAGAVRAAALGGGKA